MSLAVILSLRSSASHAGRKEKNDAKPIKFIRNTIRTGLDNVSKPIRDFEAQVMPTYDLFDNIEDTLEGIEPEIRQKLIKRSFQHPATRAVQPAIWIPHDELGIARDEIKNTRAFSSKIWISSQNTILDGSGIVQFSSLPPDRDPFENIEV